MPRVSWGGRVGWLVAMSMAGCAHLHSSGSASREPAARGVQVPPFTPVMLGRVIGRDPVVRTSFDVPKASGPRGIGARARTST